MRGIVPIIFLSVIGSILYYLYNSSEEYAKYSETLNEFRKERNDFLINHQNLLQKTQTIN